jgi:hypothetical protein
MLLKRAPAGHARASRAAREHGDLLRGVPAAGVEREHAAVQREEAQAHLTQLHRDAGQRAARKAHQEPRGPPTAAALANQNQQLLRVLSCSDTSDSSTTRPAASLSTMSSGNSR